MKTMILKAFTHVPTWVGRPSGIAIHTGRNLALAAISLMLVLAANPGSAVTAQSGTIVRCDPPAVSGYPNQTLAVNLYVQDVTNLYGADLELQFDPTIARVVDEDPSTPGVQIQPLSGFLQPGFILFKDANNSTGNVHYAMTQLNPAPPATGSGALARVRFQSLQPGSFQATYIRTDLSDRNGVAIPSTAQDCSVNWACYWADLDCNCQVDSVDISTAAGPWHCSTGQPCFDPRLDLNLDGIIDIRDIMRFAAEWSWTCPS